MYLFLQELVEERAALSCFFERLWPGQDCLELKQSAAETGTGTAGLLPNESIFDTEEANDGGIEARSDTQ